MEREVLVSGVGGQGVQLAAQSLARAAALEGREVTMFGLYGGTMRGGTTDSTVVIGDTPIEAAPIVSRVWSTIVMSDRFWDAGARRPGMARKLVPGGLLLLNTSVGKGDGLERDRFRVVEVPATELSLEATGHELAQSMVMLGAYARVTGVVAVDTLVAGMEQSLPEYRRQHAPGNEAAIRTGYCVDGLARVPFWEPALEGAQGA